MSSRHSRTSATASIVTGTVTVSHSLGERSSAVVPASAISNTHRIEVPVKDPLHRQRITIPTSAAAVNIASDPSHDFFPFTGRKFTLCFPNGIPTSAAAASPTPHIRIAAAAAFGS